MLESWWSALALVAVLMLLFAGVRYAENNITSHRDHGRHSDPIKDWKHPPLWLCDALTWFFLDFIGPPVSIVNSQNISQTRRLMIVVNHSYLGLDIFFVIPIIYRITGKVPRSLADFAHFRVPVWGRYLQYFGALPGTRDNCVKLMENNDMILIYPGGRDEVLRSIHDDPYMPVWKQRTGFAKVAAAQGYNVIPLAFIGLNDFLKPAFSVSSRILIPILGDNNPHFDYSLRIPIILPTSLWFEKCYAIFGDAHLSKIGDTAFKKMSQDTVIWKFRETIRKDMVGCVLKARKLQTDDSQRYWVKRVIDNFWPTDHRSVPPIE